MIAARLYRLALFALPSDLRHEFGDEMVQLFRDHWRHTSGAWARSQLLLASIRDVVAQSFSLQLGAVRRIRLSSPGPFMRNFFSDFRHGLRLLRRYPAMTALAVVTLAVGIGANTAIFSVVNAVLLQSLPYPHPEQLVALHEKRPSEGMMTGAVSPADFVDWRRLSTSFSAITVYEEGSANLIGIGDPVQVTIGLGSAGLFDVLGVQPFMGRGFQPDDETKGRNHVVVLSHGAWMRQFGGDPNIIGRTIMLSGNPWQIVGVLPASFRFFERDVDFFGPRAMVSPLARNRHSLDVYARLKPGVTVARAREEMDGIGKQLEKEFPDDNRGHGSHVEVMQDGFVRPVRTQLVVLTAAVGFVLLLACVNVASLLLVRAARRSREMAVRAALGASRIRLLTQSLTESMALAVMGGALGLGLAGLLIRLLPIVLPGQLSIIRTDELSLDTDVLGAAIGLSLVTGLLFGALPAIQASAPDIVEPLNQGGRGAATIKRGLRTTLVVGEVALAALTLVGAGLAIRSFSAISAQPLGFDPHGRLAVDLALPMARYPKETEQRMAMTEIGDRLRALPGVTAVGAIDILPLSGGDWRSEYQIEGREIVADAPTRFHTRVVTPTYLPAMRIPIMQGRGFTEQDDARALPVAVISETAARRFWPNTSPIGARVRFDMGAGVPADPWRTVIGIAGDVRHWGLSHPVNPLIYLPQTQHVRDDMSGAALTFVLKTDGDPAQLVASTRTAVKAFDSSLALGDAQMLDDVVAHSLRGERAQTVLMTAFGVLALFLAAIGIYGVMAQLVAARTHEIGVRMTLGARPIHILGEFLGGCVRHTVAGLVLGALPAIYLMYLGQNVLFQVKPWDALTLIAVAATLLTAAILAGLIPARRAMRVDVTEALRR